MTSVFEIFAKLGLDSSEFDSGLDKAKGALTTAMDIGIKAVAGATAAVGAFAASSVKTGMEFDKSISQVAATMGLSMSEMEQSIGSVDTAYGKFSGNLRDYAQFMGANTAFSAKQAADALNYMALAGYDAQTSMDMLPNVLNLAAAGSMELATASDMVTDAQSALGLSLEDTSVMVDQMAKASSVSNTSVQQLGEAFLTVGGTAKDLQGGTAELSAALGVLANSGIKGAEGGTALRNILLSLQPKSEDAAKAMEQLGFNAYDADGELRPLSDTFKDMAVAMDGMSTQERQNMLSNIFNKVDLKSVNAMLASASDGITKLTYALESSSVNWEQYASEPWMQGENAMMKFAQQVEYNLEDMGMSVEETADFIASEYGMAFDDAKNAVETVKYAIDDSGSSWEELQAKIEDADGAAQKMADTQLDNLAGDITLFQSALEGVQIALSDKLTPTLRGFVQDATSGLSSIATAVTAGDWSAASSAVGEFLANSLNVIIDGLPQFIDAGIQIVGALGQGLLDNLPAIVDAAMQIVVMLVEGLVKALPQLAKGAITLVTSLGEALISNGDTLLGAGSDLLGFVVDGVKKGLPKLLDSGAKMLTNLYNGFWNNLPKMITAVGKMANDMLNYILSNLPQFMSRGADLLVNIANGFINNLPQIVAAVVKMISQFVSTITQNLPQILQQGIEIIGKLVAGLIQAIPQVVAAIPKIISTIVDTFGKYDWLSIGINIIKGIASGIANAAGLIADAARNAAENAFEAAKDFLGINSPSRLMRDQVGRYISEGIAVGIEDNLNSITNSMNDVADLVSQPIDVGEVGMTGGGGSGNAYNSSNSVVINVYGAVGQNVNELAEIVSRKINASVSRRGAAWA